MATKDWKKIGPNTWRKLGAMTPSGLRYTSKYIKVKYYSLLFNV